MSAQEAERAPLVEDWTTQHVVFSNPDALATEAAPPHWFALTPEQRARITSSLRYLMQQFRRNHQQTPSEISEIEPEEQVSRDDLLESKERGEIIEGRKARLHRKHKPKRLGDWSYFFGGTKNAGVSDGMYPAKYSFDINSGPSCSNDYVAFALNQTGAAATAATGSLTFGQMGNSPPADSSQMQVGPVLYTFQTTLTAASTSDTCNVKIPAGDNGTGSAANLTAAISNSGGGNYSCSPALNNPNVVASNPSPPNDTVNLTASVGGGSGNSLTLAASSSPTTNANVSAFNHGQDGQASIVAFNNLYVAPGTQGSASGAFSANSISNGQTITITNGSTSLVLTAASTSATGSVTVDSTTGLSGTQVSIGSGGPKVQYNFSMTPVTTPGGGQCNVYEGAPRSTATTAANLGLAIGAGAGSTKTFLCASGANPNAAVTATVSGDQVILTSTVPGSEGNSTALSTNATGAEITLSGATLSGGTDGSNLGTSFQYTSNSGLESSSQLAANLASLINASGSSVGFTAVQGSGANSNQVTVFGPPNGTGNTITLSTDASGFSWSTFTGNAAPTGLCAGTAATVGAPTVMWAYNVTASAVSTWTVLSYDGTKVAFVEQNNNGAVLHLLKWKSGEGTASAPATPTNTSVTSLASCPANTSCMINVSYTGSAKNSDTNSSVFPDYGPGDSADAAFVGDDKGILYKITGMFNGTPAVAWHYSTPGGNQLTAPVYDSNTGSVFVADNGGNAYCVSDNGSSGSSCGTIAKQTGATSGFKNAIADPPILDSSAGRVYVFGNDWNVQPANTDSAAVVEIPVGSFSVAHARVADIGPQGEETLHDGIFDNAYYSSANGTGNLYACSSTTSAGNPSTIWSIPITAGVMGTTASAGPEVTTDKEECSPLNEIYNTSQGIDWLFVGAPKNCASGGSSTGCVMSFTLTNGPPAVFNNTAAENGGTSGIVVDNISTSGQASSLYFSTLGNLDGACGTNPSGDDTACAVKRTQNGLQ
jgi:hypothetical protein